MALEPWVDILPPPAPPWGAGEWGLLSLGIGVVVAAAWLGWRWWRAPSARARRRLHDIGRRLQAQQVSPRSAAHAAAAQLRPLAAHCPPLAEELAGLRPRFASAPLQPESVAASLRRVDEVLRRC